MLTAVHARTPGITVTHAVGGARVLCVLSLLLLQLVPGCGTPSSTIRTASGDIIKVKHGPAPTAPTWYHRTPPQPDELFRYAAGYSGAAATKRIAIEWAEADARKAITTVFVTEVDALLKEHESAKLAREIWEDTQATLIGQRLKHAKRVEIHWRELRPKGGSLCYDLGVVVQFPEPDAKPLADRMVQQADMIKLAERWQNVENLGKAIDYLERAHRRFPENARIPYLLADVCLSAGDPKRAIRWLTIAAAGESRWAEAARSRLRAFE